MDDAAVNTYSIVNRKYLLPLKLKELKKLAESGN